MKLVPWRQATGGLDSTLLMVDEAARPTFWELCDIRTGLLDGIDSVFYRAFSNLRERQYAWKMISWKKQQVDWRATAVKYGVKVVVRTRTRWWNYVEFPIFLGLWNPPIFADVHEDSIRYDDFLTLGSDPVSRRPTILKCHDTNLKLRTARKNHDDDGDDREQRTIYFHKPSNPVFLNHTKTNIIHCLTSAANAANELVLETSDVGGIRVTGFGHFKPCVALYYDIFGLCFKSLTLTG